MAFWPFGKKPESPTFVFEDSEKGREAFFRLQCKYGDTSIEIGKGTIAIVVDPRIEFPELKTPIRIEPDGKQTAMLKVISEDGGFIVMASTPSGRGDHLAPGDVVAWVPVGYQDIEALGPADKRMGWVGLIRTKLNWQHVGTSGGFETACRYD